MFFIIKINEKLGVYFRYFKKLAYLKAKIEKFILHSINYRA